MGLFSRIFRRKKKDELEIRPAKDAKRVRLEEVESILDRKLERLGIDFDSELLDYKSKFTKHFNELERLFDKLEKAEIERLVLENHRDVTEIIRTSRNHYVQSSKKLIGDTLICLSSEQDPEKLMATVMNAFDKMNAFSKQAQIILVSFKNEMKPIAEVLKALYSDIESLDGIMKKDYAKIREKEEMKNIAIKLISARSSQKRASDRVSHVNKDLASVMKKKEKLVFQRDELLKSKEYLHHERLRDEREEWIQKKARLLKDIEIQASGAEKIVNSYIHEARDIDKAQAEIVKSMIREPASLVSNFPEFESALKKIGKISDSTPSSKKGKKKAEKKAVKAPHLLVLRNIKDLVLEYEKAYVKEDKLAKELEISLAADKLKEINAQIEELEVDQKRLMEEKDECENTISRQFLLEQQRLENYLSELMDEKIRVA